MKDAMRNDRVPAVVDRSMFQAELDALRVREPWEDSPAGWPQQWTGTSERLRTNGRPIAQWSRLKAGRSDDLGIGRR